MKKITAKLGLTFGALLLPALMWAQPARVQVIHNCADAAASQVDVYLNDALLLDNFAFRTATPFVSLPSGVPQTIKIAPATSTSSAQAIYSLTATLDAGQTYQLIADGIVSPSGYTPAQPFGLQIFAGAREAATNPANVDVLVHHGSTDAPVVDVVETEVPAGTIVDNLGYPSFAGYLSLPEADYEIDVRDETGTVTVASYDVPLETLNLAGNALTVVASGFLNPANNSNGPAFGLFVALPSGGALIPLPLSEPPTARIQVIHNSADAAAAEVDVYVNGNLLLDNFAFRTATPFVDVPAEVALNIQVAPGTSTSAADAIYSVTATLADDGTYILIAAGNVSATGYSPEQPFAINVYPTAREEADDNDNTDVLVFHGATDAPAVDVVETSVPAGTVVNDITFGSFAGYLSLPTADYALEIQDASGAVTVARYLAPLETLGLDGAAITVVASGFLNPANNSNGPAFGLWVALPSGGPLVPLPTPSARVQVIHNSADAAAAQVDVYLNGNLLIDNFAFRTASPFVTVDAEVPLTIQVAPGTSTSAADAIYTITPTLANGETYVLVANGIVSATGYSPAQPFNIDVFAQGREAATQSNNTDVLVIHGSTDAPTVDVVETSIPAGTVVNDLAYTDFAGYLELPTADYTLDIRDASGTVTVATYAAPLATLNLQGAALTVVASGFLNPDNNSNGPAFGLWVALPTGGALIPLPTLPLSTANFQSIKPVVYPNPANTFINVSLPEFTGMATATLFDMSGRELAKISDLNQPIDISSLSSGMYLMSVNADGKVFNTKFSVSK